MPMPIFDYQLVYQGGNSWKIEATSDAILKLFKTDFVTQINNKINLVVKTSYDSKNLRLIVNQTQSLSSSKIIQLKNGWQQLIFDLPAQTKINELDIFVKSGSTNLGSLKIEAGTSPEPKNQMAKKEGSVLTWSRMQPGSLYRVYGRYPNGTYALLNEVANTTYDLRGNIFNGQVDSTQFIDFLIQEVTVAGDFFKIGQSL